MFRVLFFSSDGSLSLPLYQGMVALRFLPAPPSSFRKGVEATPPFFRSAFDPSHRKSDGRRQPFFSFLDRKGLLLSFPFPPCEPRSTFGRRQAKAPTGFFSGCLFFFFFSPLPRALSRCCSPFFLVLLMRGKNQNDQLFSLPSPFPSDIGEACFLPSSRFSPARNMVGLFRETPGQSPLFF